MDTHLKPIEPLNIETILNWQKVLLLQEGFAIICEGLPRGGIQFLYEHIASTEVREAIHQLVGPEAREPSRSALVALGEKYNIQSLIDY